MYICSTEKDIDVDQIPISIIGVEDSCGESGILFNENDCKKSVFHVLKKMFPEDYILGESFLNEQRQRQTLPLIRLFPFSETKAVIIGIFKYRKEASSFFYEMVSCWLSPGKAHSIVSFHRLDFMLKDQGEDRFTLCEIIIQLNSREEMQQVDKHFSLLQKEIILGVTSGYYATRILERKGIMSANKKALWVYEYLSHLVSRFPQNFSQGLFTEMQYLFLICNERFKTLRRARHLSKIVTVFYVFRKKIQKAIEKASHKRYCQVKVFRTCIYSVEEQKEVLAILVGINFIKEKENFTLENLKKAIKRLIPNARIIENSFLSLQRERKKICAYYVEIEKEKPFSKEEILLLRRELASNITTNIEQLAHLIFMPRNEEEVMRNIVHLGNQIKYTKDLPQVIITFDQQTDKHLIFTIIIVRVVKRGEKISIEKLFKSTKTFLEYLPDRVHEVGYIRKNYIKEANVFGIELKKENFLRSDSYIDLYKARQAVVSELSLILGEFRDFNGGMIQKQNELLSEVKRLLSTTVKYNEVLLENFFYSLNPAIMRVILAPEQLKRLFVMLLGSIKESFYDEEKNSMKTHIEEDTVFVMLVIDHASLEKKIRMALSFLEIRSSMLASFNVSLYDTSFIGYLYRCDDSFKQKQFCYTIQETIELWEEKGEE